MRFPVLLAAVKQLSVKLSQRFVVLPLYVEKTSSIIDYLKVLICIRSVFAVLEF